MNGGAFDDDLVEEFEMEENENTTEAMFREMERSMPSELRARLMDVNGKPNWEKFVDDELDTLQNEEGFDAHGRGRLLERERNVNKMIETVMESTADWMDWEIRYGIGIDRGCDGDTQIPKIRAEVREKVERCCMLKGRALTSYLGKYENTFTQSGSAVRDNFAQWQDHLTSEVNKELFCENLAVRTHHTQLQHDYENLLEGYSNLSKIVVPALLHIVNQHVIPKDTPLHDTVENDTLVFLAVLLEKERDTCKFHRRYSDLTCATCSP